MSLHLFYFIRTCIYMLEFSDGIFTIYVSHCIMFFHLFAGHFVDSLEKYTLAWPSWHHRVTEEQDTPPSTWIKHLFQIYVLGHRKHINTQRPKVTDDKILGFRLLVVHYVTDLHFFTVYSRVNSFEKLAFLQCLARSRPNGERLLYYRSVYMKI